MRKTRRRTRHAKRKHSRKHAKRKYSRRRTKHSHRRVTRVAGRKRRGRGRTGGTSLEDDSKTVQELFEDPSIGKGSQFFRVDPGHGGHEVRTVKWKTPTGIYLDPKVGEQHNEHIDPMTHPKARFKKVYSLREETKRNPKTYPGPPYGPGF